MTPFPTFFRALWGYDPFPWQAMLAERVAAGAWPRALDLPTASGKTACIDAALDHPVLRERLEASKLAELVELKVKGHDPLIDDAAARAIKFVDAGKRRVAVMVNRVGSAEPIHDALRGKVGQRADVVLMTGRMRPFDRDSLVATWKKYLRARSPEESPRPLVLVSTQCLEVGADFSFDALVTEAASLDALRQRFGRLDRMGSQKVSPAAILIRDADADPEKSEPDAIYGRALASTWKLLAAHAVDRVVDFGIDSLEAMLGEIDDLADFLAPTSDAPVLLPAHLDMLCQTSPRPAPEPDVGLFLHGKDGGAPEARVLWRADLAPDQPDDAWVETIALCPPVGGEMLSVPLYRLCAFLSGSTSPSNEPDIEGVPDHHEHEASAATRCLVWRGRDRSVVLRDSLEIRPGDVIVLSATRGIQGLGQAVRSGVGPGALDIWERAVQSAGRPPTLRLNRAVLAHWLDCPPVANLVATAEAPDSTAQELDEAIAAVLAYKVEDEGAPAAPPSWWLESLQRARRGRKEPHPAGGVVLVRAQKSLRKAEPDLFADDDDLTSWAGEAVSLDEHSELVRRTAVERIARRCLPEEYWPVVSLAAYWHDVGKLDERFQIMLHNGDELRALSTDAPLAKSQLIASSPARRKAIRDASGLPPDFRHEMLSAELAAGHAPLPADPDSRDLCLHLIASHHGHARPFAPVSPDLRPPAVTGRLGTVTIAMSADERAALPPAHRADSGLAERFWRLVRRHGWWGVAYLEAVVRLADWYASGHDFNDEMAKESLT